MAEFDPRQLDQLEDALESLEDIDDLESLELSPALTERLAEYQDVLALCREAFPLEEPRAEVLADVIAEAHALSRRVAPREPDGSRWRRFWTRWRGVLVPGVALAGTATAVLLLLEPGQPLDHGAELLSNQQLDRAGDSNERINDRIEELDTTPSEPANMTRKQALDQPAAANDEGAEPNSATPSEPAEVPGSASSSTVKKKTRIQKGAAPVEPPKPAVEPLSKDDTWTKLERANADRRKGDCDRARARYQSIIEASSDGLAIARAKAGIGLCLEQERRSAEAEKWFDQARSASVGIDAWIDKQRDEQPLPGETKKSKSKPQPADADAL